MAHIESNTHLDINPKVSKDSKNVNAFYKADTIVMKDFMLNFGGYPRSEVAIINDQANAVLAEDMLSRLVVMPTDDNANVGLSDAEIMLSHRSKYCQMPSEQIEFLDGVLSRRDAKIREMQEQKRMEDEARKAAELPNT